MRALQSEGVPTPVESQAFGHSHTFTPPVDAEARNTLDDVLEELARLVEEDEPRFETQTSVTGVNEIFGDDPQGNLLSELAERIPTEDLPATPGELLEIAEGGVPSDSNYEAPPPPIWRVHSRRSRRTNSERQLLG
jgi:hypothetical protein